ncbi:MAG: ergothioneine biosynthesis protein EgtB [Planctomycetota bacterium]
MTQQAARASHAIRADTASERDDLLQRYHAVRSATDRLVARLTDEDMAAQVRTEASPTKWHLAHTTWFFETFILEAHEAGFAPFHEDFRVLFNSYYNSVGAQHPRERRGALTRPTSECVRGYRNATDQRVARLLSSCDDATFGNIGPVLEIGLQHEQQHQELILTDLKLLLSFNPLYPAYTDFDVTLPVPPPTRDVEFLTFEGGLVEIGHRGGAFAYDNESPRHKVWLEPFGFADRLVTNAEYQRFIDDDGYQRTGLWLSEGLAAVRANAWTAPAYWTERDGVSHEFTLAGLRPLDPCAPVCHISFYEADAYARWCAGRDEGVRLPTEAEWEHAAATSDAHDARSCVLDTPGAHPERDDPSIAESARGHPRQLLGACWQWTGSAYRPYPGYRPPAGALGEYNGKFMCNQHVLRGGSVATPPEHTRPTYRNFFHPDARWQFAGIRLARDAN